MWVCMLLGITCEVCVHNILHIYTLVYVGPNLVNVHLLPFVLTQLNNYLHTCQ